MPTPPPPDAAEMLPMRRFSHYVFFDADYFHLLR
jgi:hypothetical protein